MREKIIRVSTELFILHGYRGVSFADIAGVLGVTTTSIHYHFGKKLGLAAAVLDSYADSVASRFREIWTNREKSLRQKVVDTVEFNREAYHRFNPSGNEGHAWSLLTRFIGDRDALDDVMRHRLAAYRREVHACASEAIDIAVAAGELSACVPREDVARVLAVAFTHAASILHDAGGFTGLERYYNTVLDMVYGSYGTPHGNGPPVIRHKAPAKL